MVNPPREIVIPSRQEIELVRGWGGVTAGETLRNKVSLVFVEEEALRNNVALLLVKGKRSVTKWRFFF